MSGGRKLLESLPRLPATVPEGCVPLSSLIAGDGSAILVGRTPDGRYILVDYRSTADGVLTEILTPAVTEEQIVAVAEAVAGGDAQIATWPHAAKVLALGVLVAVSTSEDPPAEPAAAPPPDPQPASPAPEAVAV